ncbi:putative membrane protein [Halorhabdus sp. SVX81]|nr:putative membrane protein [Halorhabdus sp. SVX81]
MANMANAGTVAVAVIGLVVGLVLIRWGYTIARWREIIDAIGRKRAGRVEPADWHVGLVKSVGVVLVVYSSVIVIGFLLQ